MALSIGGLGSGIDTAALVQTLMQAERVPQNRVKALQDAAQKRITAWNELRTRTTTVQSAAEALGTPAKALGASATSTDPAVVKVTASDGALPTQLSLRVLSVATAAQSKVTGLTPGMLVGAGTSVLHAGLPGTGISGLSFDATADSGVHTVVVTSGSAPAVAHGTAATSLTATDLTVQVGSGDPLDITLSASYPDADGNTLVQDLQAKLDEQHPGVFTVGVVGGRLELRTRLEGSAETFTLGGGAATALGLPTTAVSGRAAVLTVGGVRQEVEPAETGTTTVDVGGGLTLTVGTSLRPGTISSNLVRTTATTTLADLQGMLNAAGSPVTATTLTESGSSTLVLTSRGTGTAGALQVEPGGLALLTGRTPVTAAKDAVVELGPGLTATRSSNRITDLVPGVTLDLLQQSAGTSSVGITVSQDAGSTSTKVKALVDAMNGLLGSVGTLTKYDPTTRAGGPLSGDGTARELGRALFSAATVTGSGTIRSLAQVGVETTREGTFVLKGEVLTKALETDPEGVAAVLAQLGTAVGDYAKEMARTGGRISQSRDGAQADVTARQKQVEAMEQRLERTERRLRAQYAALESAMGQLTARSTSLSAALSGLARPS